MTDQSSRLENIKHSKQRIVIVGCGKIGMRLAEQLSEQHEVWGLRRSHAEHQHISFIQADVTEPEGLAESLPEAIDYLLYCLTPSEASEEGYRAVYVKGLQHVLSALKQPLKRLYFISSTSVYHQDDSSWVDEASPTQPTRYSGKVLLEAEQLAQLSQHPATVVRFSGIYGGNRSRLIEQVKRGKAVLTKSSRLTNRIHEDDCVGFLQHLIQQDIEGIKNDDLYLASDSEPVEYNEVIEFIAAKFEVDLALGDAESKRRAGNKRCSNRRMLESGYRLKFPSFREGYLEAVTAPSDTLPSLR